MKLAPRFWRGSSKKELPPKLSPTLESQPQTERFHFLTSRVELPDSLKQLEILTLSLPRSDTESPMESVVFVGNQVVIPFSSIEGILEKRQSFSVRG